MTTRVILEIDPSLEGESIPLDELIQDLLILKRMKDGERPVLFTEPKPKRQEIVIPDERLKVLE